MKASSNEALVIVDMQPHFEKANRQETIQNVCKLVRRAMAKNQPIIILEYSNCGPTIKDILNDLEGYPNVFCETKSNDDGSYEVFRTIENNLSDNPPKNFIVCGVNIEYCVVDTIRGMLLVYGNRVNRIRVPMPACNGWYTPQESWQDFRKKIRRVNIDHNKIRILRKVPV